ncbi:MAG: hypothetical protein EYC70_01305 [Planctomycetota bacterium]|nr:MAG: hypothetical protein EYC70_01305 [Planctomycetota bacterium]
MNADGYPDAIVGAVGAAGNAYARVFSGFDGTVLHTWYGGGQFGVSVSGAGDVNADGYDDAIVGARFDNHSGYEAGMAQVFSGIDGSVLYTWYADSERDQFGYSVSDAGDVNADGHDDVVVGAPWGEISGSANGSARVYSGLDGSILHTWYGDAGVDNFGYSVSGAGDTNADGHDDVIAGAWHASDNNSAGSARVLSGLDGSILYTWYGDSWASHFGISVSGAGDVNADGYADLIVGAESVRTVRVFGSSPVPLSLGSPTPGQAGVNNTLALTGCEPGRRELFLAGLGTGVTAVPCAGGRQALASIEDAQPLRFAIADAGGRAQIAGQAPAHLQGLGLRLPAVEVQTGRFSNLVVCIFQ